MVCPRQGCGKVSWESGIKAHQHCLGCLTFVEFPKKSAETTATKCFLTCHSCGWARKNQCSVDSFDPMLWYTKKAWFATLPGASKAQKVKSRRCLKKSLGILKDTFFNRNLIAIQLPSFLDLDSWFESPWSFDAGRTLSFVDCCRRGLIGLILWT